MIGAVPVERDHVRSDEIEVPLADAAQLDESLDVLRHHSNVEQVRDRAKHRGTWHIQAEDAVPE
jgi:hypothetical protein